MDEFVIRLTFLAIGLIMGWIAGMAFTTMRYAKEAKREAHDAKQEVQHLREERFE